MMARRNEQSAKDKAKATAKESEEKKAAARLESKNEAEVEAMKEAEKKDREQAALEKKTREMPKEKAKKDEVNATIVVKEVPGESGAGAPAVDFDPSKSMVPPPQKKKNLTMLHVARSLRRPAARALSQGGCTGDGGSSAANGAKTAVSASPLPFRPRSTFADTHAEPLSYTLPPAFPTPPPRNHNLRSTRHLPRRRRRTRKNASTSATAGSRISGTAKVPPITRAVASSWSGCSAMVSR